MSFIVLGVMPGLFDSPIMVNVLPVPVWPYAKIVPKNKSNAMHISNRKVSFALK